MEQENAKEPTTLRMAAFDSYQDNAAAAGPRLVIQDATGRFGTVFIPPNKFTGDQLFYLAVTIAQIFEWCGQTAQYGPQAPNGLCLIRTADEVFPLVVAAS